MAEDMRKDIPAEDIEEEAVRSEDAPAPDDNATDTAQSDAGEEPKAEPEQEDKGDAMAEELARAKEVAKQESDRYLRLLADFQNYRNRTEKEKSDIRTYANEKVVGELLPVLDNFQRALDTKTDDIESYAKGMDLIFQQMLTAFDHIGVKEIPAEGQMFDPAVHNAVMTDQSDELEDGTISKVLQKGYTLNGRVIRPSMVAVVKK